MDFVCVQQKCCCLCSSSLLLIFTLLSASVSRCLTGATKFSCCSSKELSLLCFSSLALALALSLCYPRQCRHENLVEKKKRGFVASSLFKSLGGHAIYRQHAQELKYEISLRLTGDRRTDGQVNTRGVLDISLGGEVRPGPSYPDPVYDKNR